MSHSLSKTSCNVSTLNYTYDAANQLLSETQDVSGGSARSIFYDYDADGNRLSTIYPTSESLSYTYTGRNQLDSVILSSTTTPLAIYTYDLAGNRISKMLLNQTTASYTYDDANRMTALEHKNGQVPFARFDYDYDSVNRRKFVKRDNAKGDVFVYDAIDQVTGVHYETSNPDRTPTSPLRTVAYDYDKGGNRASVTDNAILTTYAANNLDQYTKVGLESLTHNANGNLTTHHGWTYTYDAQNRLIEADNGITTASFAYDGRNRCVKRVIDGSTTLFYYDGWNLIEEDRGPLDPEHVRYFRGAWVDELLAKQTDLDTQYYHHDSLGNVTHLTDVAGSVSERYAYDAFGAPTIRNASGIVISSTAIGNRFLYTGREWIDEINLFDYRNRFYSPELGRFISADPVGFAAGSVNLYGYCLNGPLNALDPFGLITIHYYGNYGGPGWTMGRESTPEEENNPDLIHPPPEPIDDQDCCYMVHDQEMARCNRDCANKDPEVLRECKRKGDDALQRCLRQARGGDNGGNWATSVLAGEVLFNFTHNPAPTPVTVNPSRRSMNLPSNARVEQ